MPSCAFPKCCNNTSNKTKSSGVTFHSFPSNFDNHKKWVKIVRLARRDEEWVSSKKSRICSDHFRKSEMYVTEKGYCKLTKTAVPYEQMIQQEHLLQASSPSSPSSNVSVPSSIFDSPGRAELKKEVKRLSCENKTCKLQIKSLKQKNSRLTKKCFTLKSIVRDLEKKKLIAPDFIRDLELKAESAEIINRIYMNRKGKSGKRKYPPALRKFALTLHFYSAAAYLYVRRVFATALPHPRTLRKWYENTTAEPGFTTQAFQALEAKSKASGKRLIGTLVADEMAIRQQTLWNGKKTIGLVDYGLGQSESDEIATQVYAFVLVINDQNCKIPLGYFFINGLPGTRRASLIKTCLQKCYDVGVDVIALTFDGCSANFSAARILGCRLDDDDNMKTTFKHPSNDSEVAVFLDPCHMLKLVRNTFESKGVIFDNNGEQIMWSLLKNLTELQEGEGLHLGNKLTRRHIEFRNQIMKVKLAVQLTSASVAKALEMCKDMALPMFAHVNPTVKFIENFNNLFDILNSRKNGKYGYKKPICPQNHADIFKFLESMELYIKSLKIEHKAKCTTKKVVSIKITKKKITTCQCKTGFVGFLICIKSLKHLYNTLVETQKMAYISTYKISQDHIELLFGLIRSHGGHNNNPNATQFMGIYRKLFNHLQLRSSFTGNCIPLDNYQILKTSASNAINETSSRNTRLESTESTGDSNSDADTLCENNTIILAGLLDAQCIDVLEISKYSKYIVGYIAGWVARKLSKTIKCETCIDSLVSAERLWFHKLILLKSMGGLVFPTEDLFEICYRAETCIRKYVKQKESQHFTTEKEIKYISSEILKMFVNSPVLNVLTLHTFEQHATTNHRTLLIKAILEKYINVRLHHLHKNDPAIKIHTKRQRVNKLVLFEGK